MPVEVYTPVFLRVSRSEKGNKPPVLSSTRGLK